MSVGQTRRAVPGSRGTHLGTKALGQGEMVLLALAHASAWTTNRVAYEDLVLQAWRDFPEFFSLRNHPEHPDASDIHKRLYQTLKPNGWAATLGNKVFRLTEEGVERARELEAANTTVTDTSRAAPERLRRDEQSFIEQALASRVLTAWRAGRGESLVDYDARTFFQFSTGTPTEERRRRVQLADNAIAKARRLDIAGADDLQELAETLKSRFARLFGGD
jgi:hypothetical protein